LKSEKRGRSGKFAAGVSPDGVILAGLLSR